MLVKDLMTTNVNTCREDADLATAAKMMWDGDCGIVPVLDGEGHVIGVVTDRDICIAAATRSMSPADIGVTDAMTRDITTCDQDDDIRTVLTLFKDSRIRRVPVVNQNERLVGIISMNDVVSRAECRRGAAVAGEEVLDALKAICAHPTPTGAAA